MDATTHTLLELSALAASPEHRDALRERLRAAKEEAIVERTQAYESFLQLYLFAGFPAALEAMRALSAAWPTASEEDRPLSVTYPDFVDRGRELFDRIYAGNAD